jgi:hypothetical protein
MLSMKNGAVEKHRYIADIANPALKTSPQHVVSDVETKKAGPK